MLDISQPDFALGMLYVAVSRVRSLGGIIFKESFDLDQFKLRGSNMAIIRGADTIRRHRHHMLYRIATAEWLAIEKGD